MALVRTDSSKYHENAVKFVAALPLYTPEEMFQILEEKGYRGQEEARRAVCLMAYRHIRRLKNIYVHGVSRDKLPPRSNYLLMGPTGCGKTFLVELLFREILRLPTVIVDMTTFSETGYVGDDVKTILTRLLYAAGMNPVLASFGVVCLDEFDKLATTHNTARFDGAGTTKDVSGLGVQRELLKLLEGSEVAVPLDYNNTVYSQRVNIHTQDIVFIGCGAFSGFKSLYARRKGSAPGFLSEVRKTEKETIAVDYDEEAVEDIETFSSYGFLPELIGRFSRIIPMRALDRDTLKQILLDNVVDRFKNEFQTERLQLEVKDDVLEFIVEQSLRRQTGARGLESLLTKQIEEAAFHYFGKGRKGKVILFMKGDRPASRFVPLR